MKPARSYNKSLEHRERREVTVMNLINGHVEHRVSSTTCRFSPCIRS